MTDKPTSGPRRSSATAAPRDRRVTTWVWLILKNVIGWILMVAAWPVGILLPGPGGIPLFLIGFALITFPGKRRLTARVLRGRKLNLGRPLYTLFTAAVAVVAVPLILWLALVNYHRLAPIRDAGPAAVAALYLLVVSIAWLGTRMGLRVVNWILRAIPRIRRYVRPWMKSHGIRLLPPRWRRRHPRTGARHRQMSEDILLFHERHLHRLRGFWDRTLPWLLRWTAAIIALAVFIGFAVRIHRQWSQIRDAIREADPWRLLVAVIMFFLFLLVFRVSSWRWILTGLGHRLPKRAAARIWSASEFARYIPGGIWQIVGRVWLCGPYGVGAAVCSASQILELAVFLLANILVAGGCLIWFGWKIYPHLHHWLSMLTVVLVALLILLHPRIFYWLIDAVLDFFSRPPVVRRLTGWDLVGLTFWNILGLLWQSLAIWLIVAWPLGLKLAWWWMVAGAYCLAWCVGFLSFFAPAGIGVREFIFVIILMDLLPPEVKGRFPNADSLRALVAFLSIALRLWAMAGELILLGSSHTADWRGLIQSRRMRDGARPPPR